MLDERKEGDPLEGARVMLMGRAVSRPTSMTAAAISRASRKRRCSRALPISRSTGSRFRAAHLVAGFGRIVDLKPQDILVDVAGADDLLAAEEGAVAT